MSGYLDPGSGGSSDDDTSDGGDDGTTGGGSGDGGLPSTEESFWGLAPDWLESNRWTFKDFLKNPVSFILGAILAYLLNVLETIWTALLDAVLAVYGAFAVVPESVASSLIGAGGFLSNTAFMFVIEFNDSIISAAEAAGLAAPIIGTVVIVAEGIALLWLLETLVKIVIDAIPGGGGILS